MAANRLGLRIKPPEVGSLARKLEICVGDLHDIALCGSCIMGDDVHVRPKDVVVGVGLVVVFPDVSGESHAEIPLRA